MTKRKNWLLVLVLAIVAALGICLVSACGGAKYSVTWDVSEHATVTVTGFDKLPSEVAEETSLSFIVTAETGYEVSSVSVNGRSVTADKNGNYTAVVKAEMTIKVETVEKVSTVTVKTNPSNLTYYAGQELDPAGMVVEVEYGTGRKADETGYSVVYKNGAAFALGDTSFTVKFRGVESAPVTLAQAVEVKIELDPATGAFSDEYYDMLKANTEIKNLAKSESGVISFTYTELTEDIALPAKTEWSKGEDGDYELKAWNENKISKDNDTSVLYTAQYKINLVIIDSVKYEVRTVEGENGVPCLIITGKFKAAQTAYLYLYEGNDEVELKGNTIGDANTKKNDPFELVFDMRKLVEKEYKGKWMDIKFCAGEGDNVETQEIDLNDYSDDFLDSTPVTDGVYGYSFAIYTPEGTKERNLKALYSDLLTQFTMEIDKVGDDVVLTIAGSVPVEHAGKTVYLDFEIGNNPKRYTVIDEEGKYSATFVLSDREAFPLNTSGYAHFKVVESQENENNVILAGDNNNLLNSGCVSRLKNYNVDLIENMGALRYEEENGTVYYVGMGKWGGIVCYMRNETEYNYEQTATEVKLESTDDKATLAISGTYTGDAADGIKALTDWLNTKNNDVQSMDSWASKKFSVELNNVEIAVADGKWSVKIDLSALELENGNNLVHFLGEDFDLSHYEGMVNAGNTVTVGEKVYKLETQNHWDRDFVIIVVSNVE